MSEKEFVQSIGRLWHRLEFLGVGEEFSHPVSLTPSNEFIRLALDASTTYEDLYLCGLKNRDFNILLSGFSYFQFSRSVDGMRFAYYPNPLLGAATEAISELSEKKEYVDEGIISLEEYLHEISELRFPVQSPPIRYEYDPNAYRELRHPCSHFHVGFHSDNRWAASRIFSPEAFGLWMTKLYSGGAWHTDARLALGDKSYSPEELLAKARQGTTSLGDDYFAATENLTFHIS
ncbi:DUF2290 domain-containing protein [Ruegeria faecimaris]|uniref:DUF2290 domain-containing protein n=1 Tax=Ruegeria faecimaris TaxID=686389 RepID=UPI00248FA419|nr:DUF2290 domain-containing protein [Ruegeria faecimaris]